MRKVGKKGPLKTTDEQTIVPLEWCQIEKTGVLLGKGGGQKKKFVNE